MYKNFASTERLLNFCNIHNITLIHIYISYLINIFEKYVNFKKELIKVDRNNNYVNKFRLAINIIKLNIFSGLRVYFQ